MFFKGLLVLVTALCASRAIASSSNSKGSKLVHVSDSGSFTVVINDQQWFSSSEVFFRSAGKLFSTNDASLQYVGQQTSHGRDQLGTYEKHALQWRTACGQHSFFGNILEYNTALVFEQVFPLSLTNTSSGDADGVISSFPSFDLRNPENKQDLGYAQWVSWYYTDTDSDNDKMQNQHEQQHRRALVAPGFESPLLGRWNDVQSSANITGGMGGSGVICVFETGAATATLNKAVVLAPLNHFMAASHDFDTESGSLAFGIMGNVTSVPGDFALKTILFVGNGINGAMRDWGIVMRDYYGKVDAREAYQKDVTLQYLGYTTDNGAYYYYNTVPNMNYQDTMEKVKSYADEANIPYKYVLLDSWFYYRGSNDGVTEWDAMPDIFPDGVKAVYENTGLLIQAHNRYWAPDTVYATQNNGNYEFIVDMINDGAAPTDDSFWTDLLATPAASWGLRVYEQDWLFNEVLYVREMLESTSRARTWLLQMGQGASRHNLTIQYCMPYVRHLLQSLEVSSVTQARASDDYKPSDGDSGQWRIAGQNILINALGLAPSKDGVYSVSIQDGNPYGVSDGTVLEPHPRLQSVVAALSAGPIAIADGISNSDRDLILKSCMEDGRLLTPSRPAMTIDQVLHRAALGTPGVDGEVWLAESTVINDQKRSVYYYLFATEISVAYDIYPADLLLNDPDQAFYAFESSDTSVIKRFSSTDPLRLEPCGEEGDFLLWTITPVEVNGMGVQGEVNKWVGISEARFGSIEAVNGSDNEGREEELIVEVYGVPNETIVVGFVTVTGQQLLVTCTFNEAALNTRPIPSALQQGKSSMEYLTMRVSSTGACAGV